MPRLRFDLRCHYLLPFYYVIIIFAATCYYAFADCHFDYRFLLHFHFSLSFEISFLFLPPLHAFLHASVFFRHYFLDADDADAASSFI